MNEQEAKAICQEIARNYAENGEEEYCKALDMAESAMEMQIKLKEWIYGYCLSQEFFLLNKEQLISILEEFRIGKGKR